MPSITSPPNPTSSPRPSKEPLKVEEEEDYLSMTILEPSTPAVKETYTQRRTRLARASEAKSQRPAPTPLPRPSALETSIPTTSKGFQMLSKLGYKPGSTLGSKNNPNARLEPLGVVVKEDRGGVGMDSEKKRKFREEVEGERERERESEVGYRERVAREREERRLEGLVRMAMGVVEGFEGKEEEGKRKKPTRQINVLWRGLVQHREDRESERRMRYDLHQSLSRNTNYDDPEEDRDDRQALGKEEEEVEEVDEELEAFEALEPKERLRRLVEYLRERYRYCFWCKFRYPDEGMEGCPGLTEDDHD